MVRAVTLRRVWLGLALPLFVLFAFAAPRPAPAQPVDPAQAPAPGLPPAPGYPPDQGPIFAPGFAVVTGFSGAVPSLPSPPPGANPTDLLTIDLNGPALRAVDARSLGGPPRGQVVPAPKPLTVRAGDIGQVFAVTLDDAAPPNIYAAATSAYGLPIVTPDRNGDGAPDRVQQGAPDANFMPGLFGPTAEAGPGTIWRIDGMTGQVSIFANVTLDGRPNSGAALGGLAFDRASRLLFVADRESGFIHAFAPDGLEVARYDHGTDGFAALGLPPLPFDPSRGMDVTSPAFDASNPATWNYAPPVRRAFGLAVHRSRLYYAVAAGERIFSVGLTPDGAFSPNVRLEYALPPSSVPGTEVSKIVFDDAGNMIVAERAPPSGAYDFGALTAEGAGRVLRLRAKPPGAGGTPFHWADAGEYAIGFPGEFRNGDGGIAIGNGFDAAGYLNFAACGGTLWTTGSQLRIADNPAFGERLAALGPLPIDGLQGNAVGAVRPQNTPPFASYFIDFDDVAEQAGTPGHMGDVVTWRACPGPLYPMVAELLFEEAFCPAGFYFGRNQCLPAPCRIGEVYRAGICERPECVPDRRDPLCCPPGTKWNPRTQSCDRPTPRRPDLKIVKTVLRCGLRGCTYGLVVTNVGDAPYSGVILVGDYVQPGQVTSVTGPSAQWQCAAATNNIWACVNPNVTLGPTDPPLVFTATVELPPGKRWKNCAAVTGDPAKGETNWGNNKSCVEGGDTPDKPDEKPDLKVEKRLLNCFTVRTGGRLCNFEIVVTNVGNAPYNGEVVLSDAAMGGNINALGGGTSGWTCQQGQAQAATITSLWTCRRPGPIPPQGSVSLPVRVGGPEGLKNCAIVTNVVGDENNANNGQCANDKPKQPEGPNLTIAKTAPASCTRVSGITYRCEFTISVTNPGPGDHTGEVVVSDATYAGQIVQAGGAGWNCTAGSGTTWTCRRQGGIGGGQSPSFTVVVEVTGVSRFTNCAVLGDRIRAGSLPALSRTRLAASEVPRDLLLRLAEGPLPPGGGGQPPSGQTPPPAATPPPATPPAATPPEPPSACASVEIPPEGPTSRCPAGTIATLRGGCCTPESVAAGTCGGTAEKCVPTPTQFVGDDGRCYERPGQACMPPLALYNDRCCNLREIQAGTCGGTTTETCTPPLLSHNGRCCNLREIQTGTCGGTTSTCTFPLIQVGNTCCSREALTAGTCGGIPPPTQVGCKFPLIQVGNTCCTREALTAGTCGGIPPPTQVGCTAPLALYNGRCCNLREIQTGNCGGTPPPTLISDPCPGGAARVRGVCPGGPGGGGRCGTNQFRGDDGTCQNKPGGGRCGANQFRGDDGTCQNKPKQTQPSCGSGMSWDGRRCVPPPGKKPPKITKPTGPIKKPPSLGTKPSSGAFTGAKPPASSRTITAPPRSISAPPRMRR